MVQGIFRGGCFLTSNFKPIFDLLNGIIWTSSCAGNLFKIKFSSQGSLNNAIFMNGLKITDKEWNEVETAKLKAAHRPTSKN